MIDFLKSHPLISLRQLEKICSIPHGTLDKCTKGKRKLPVKHEKKLREELIKYGLIHK